jgi:hypothetical protein
VDNFTTGRYSPHCLKHFVVSESSVFLAAESPTALPFLASVQFVYRLACLWGIQLTSFALAKALTRS